MSGGESEIRDKNWKQTVEFRMRDDPTMWAWIWSKWGLWVHDFMRESRDCLSLVWFCWRWGCGEFNVVGFWFKEWRTRGWSDEVLKSEARLLVLKRVEEML